MVSCIYDCATQSCVIRVPYEMAVKMLNGLPPSEEKGKLALAMRRASGKSKKFSKLMEES